LFLGALVHACFCSRLVPSIYFMYLMILYMLASRNVLRCSSELRS
jgi:hypothetical protein